MRISKLSAAVLTCIALSACGGGDGSNNDHKEQSIVVQDFNFDAFSSYDVADVITGGNFNENSRTTVCLDLNHDNSCDNEVYSVSGEGLSFTGKLEWPENLDIAGVNILADNTHFVYSIPTDPNVNGLTVLNSTSERNRLRVYINPVTASVNADGHIKDAIFEGYTGTKYSTNDFSIQSSYSKLDREIKTLGDSLIPIIRNAKINNLPIAELLSSVSGSLQKIIDYYNTNASALPSQVVVNVIENNDFEHLNPMVDPIDPTDPIDPVDPQPAINKAPIANFSFEFGTDGWVTFTNNSSDPDGDKINYVWDFNDGTKSTDEAPKHQFAKNGNYTVYLNVTDGKLSSSVSMDVIISNVVENTHDEGD